MGAADLIRKRSGSGGCLKRGCHARAELGIGLLVYTTDRQGLFRLNTMVALCVPCALAVRPSEFLNARVMAQTEALAFEDYPNVRVDWSLTDVEWLPLSLERPRRA